MDAVRLVERLLKRAAAVRFADGAEHGIGNRVRVHDHAAVHVARRAADGLHQRRFAAQKALLVRVQNGDQLHLRQIQTLAQKVYAHQHVVFAQPQRTQKPDALQRLHVRVQIFHAHVHLAQVIRKALRHALGERGHQRAAAALGHPAHLAQQVVHLPLGGTHDDLRVEKARGADDLLHHVFGARKLVGPRRGGHINRLPDALLKFKELQRAVVKRARQAEAVIHQRALARVVAVVHGANLRHGDVRLVDEHQKVLREIVQQRERRVAGPAAVEVARIVFDAGAIADFAHHLNIVARALLQPLRLHQTVARAQRLHLLVQVALDVLKAGVHLLARGHIVRRGIQNHVA